MAYVPFCQIELSINWLFFTDLWCNKECIKNVYNESEVPAEIPSESSKKDAIFA